MNAPCPEPVQWEQLVDYWAGDLDDAVRDQIEEHLVGCAACSDASARVAAIAQGIRGLIPPVISPEALEQLRARGVRIEDNPTTAGTRKIAVFREDVDVLLHRLGGLALQAATVVDVTVSVEETGEVILRVPDAPFDRARGEVLIACQQHFAVFPPNIVFDVRVRSGGSAEQVARYTIPHAFETRTTHR